MPGALDQGLDDGGGQIVGADLAKDPLLLVSAANGRADAIDDDGLFHEFSYLLKRRDRSGSSELDRYWPTA